jgi:hypothetical protein
MTIFLNRYFYHKNEGTLFHIDFKNGELHPTARQIAKYSNGGLGVHLISFFFRYLVLCFRVK